MVNKASRAALLILLIMLVDITNSNEFKSQRQLQSTTQQMRIYVEYTDSDNQWQNSTLKDKYNFCKQIMERTKLYYSSVLMVKNRKESYTWPDTAVTETKTVTGRTTPYDLWTYFYVYNQVNNNFAAAGPSAFDDTTGRPIVGYFELNLNAISSLNSLGAISYTSTFVHEFYHIIVFNSDLFDRFRDSSGNLVGRANLVGSVIIGSKTQTTYKGTNVLNWVRTYLSASSLTQIVLENDGGAGSAGSHWEHRYWATDYMSPIDTRPNALSALSLKMALDSGWFTVNDAFVEELEYGKGGGDIQAAACPTSGIKGFCDTDGQLSCGPDWMFKAKCYSDSTYSETCYFKWAEVFCTIKDGDYGAALDSTLDNLGDSSRCVMGTPSGGPSAKPLCAKTSCSGTSSVTYTFGNGKTCTCTSANAGQTATCTDASVSVTCITSAEISDLCTRLQDANRCPSDCNGKGICLGASGSKKCFCIYGWMGNDCNTVNSNETSAVPISSNTTNTTTTKTTQILNGVIFMTLINIMLLN